MSKSQGIESVNGFGHDTRHMTPTQLGQFLGRKSGPYVRAVAAVYGIATSHQSVAKLIEEIVAYRASWPRPSIGLRK